MPTNEASQTSFKPVDSETRQRIEEVIEQSKPPKAESNRKAEKPNKPKATPSVKNDEEIAPASQHVENKTVTQAQALVQADQKAKQSRLQIGLREGLADAKDVRQGYQLGLLAGITKGKVEDTQQLSEQLQLLRQHTDSQSASAVEKVLKDYLEDSENIDPLSVLVEELAALQHLPTSKESLKIFA